MVKIIFLKLVLCSIILIILTNCKKKEDQNYYVTCTAASNSTYDVKFFDVSYHTPQSGGLTFTTSSEVKKGQLIRASGRALDIGKNIPTYLVITIVKDRVVVAKDSAIYPDSTIVSYQF